MAINKRSFDFIPIAILNPDSTDKLFFYIRDPKNTRLNEWASALALYLDKYDIICSNWNYLIALFCKKFSYQSFILYNQFKTLVL